MAFALDYSTSGLFYVYYTAKSPVGRSRSRSTASTRPIPTTRTPPTRGRWSRSRTTSRPTTTAASCSSVPTACSTRAPATAAAAAIRAATRRPPRPPLGGGASRQPRLPPRQAPADRPGHRRRLDLRLRPAQPVALLLRPQHRRPLIGDVGQDRYEEVDFAAAPGDGAGVNYGWNQYEGLHTYPGNAPAGAAGDRPARHRVPAQPGVLDHRRLRGARRRPARARGAPTCTATTARASSRAPRCRRARRARWA